MVIDPSRLPSQGRDVATLLRRRKATRHGPLVFVGGDAPKVRRIRVLLPDASYTCWERIGEPLREAIASSLTDPVVPDSQFAAYAGKPLVDKLGIKPHSVVRLESAPAGFGETLGELPEGARLWSQPAQACDSTIWFSRSVKELMEDLERMVPLAERAPLWVAWPERASGRKTDLTRQRVREAGLSAGLVDYKICSIDKTWSGLLFTKRRPAE